MTETDAGATKPDAAHAQRVHHAEASPSAPGQANPWAWQPTLPLQNSPLFTWPPKPWLALRYLLGRGFLLSTNSVFILFALLTWYFLLPPVETWKQFSVGWIAQVLLINLGLLVIVAGGLHLYYYTFRRQQKKHKFDPRELSHKSAKFLFGNQVWDNIFWSCASGVPICTGFQVVIMWAYANGYTPGLSWEQNPVLFALWFPLLAIWSSLHFYWVHRWLHWPPLFQLAHYLHHKNNNIGPWSGIAMHPLEHVLYLSSLAIHLVLASHPIHLFYHVYLQILSPPATHSGFADLQIKGRATLALGDFFHQLHHRYFDCNYGTTAMPWDQWFRSFHDGTAESTARIRAQQMQRRGQR